MLTKNNMSLEVQIKDGKIFAPLKNKWFVLKPEEKVIFNLILAVAETREEVVKNLKEFTSQATIKHNFELSKALKNNGYLLFEAKEGNSKQYDASVPVLTVNANTVTASKACKFVVWRKPKGSADTNYTAIHRTTELANSLYFGFIKTEYEYIVGAISRSRVSSVVTI